MYPSVLGSSSFSFLNIGMCSPILVNRPRTVDIVMVCVSCVVSVLVTSYMLREVCRTVQAAGRLSYLPVPPRYHQGAALPSTTSRPHWLNILIKYKLFNVLACTSTILQYLCITHLWKHKYCITFYCIYFLVSAESLSLDGCGRKNNFNVGT